MKTKTERLIRLEIDNMFLIIACVILLCTQIGTIAWYEYDKTETPTSISAHGLAFTGQNLSGIYFPRSSFCVYVGGRNEERIQETVYHEACHHLVAQDYAHFCDKRKHEKNNTKR